MPLVRKLAVEEVQAMNDHGKSQRKLVEEQYDAILAGYAAGDWGEAAIEPGESRLTVRNRLSAAAARRQLSLVFRRTGLDVLRFLVVLPVAQPEPAAATAATEVQPAPKPKRRAKATVEPPAPAPKRRGGRIKKAV